MLLPLQFRCSGGASGRAVSATGLLLHSPLLSGPAAGSADKQPGDDIELTTFYSLMEMNTEGTRTHTLKSAAVVKLPLQTVWTAPQLGCAAVDRGAGCNCAAPLSL